MHGIRALWCAFAITALLAPSVRGDEYTKQTFLTFSGPVQLPTVTLPAGTYQFRLADPDSGRRTLQVWNQDGTKLFATLLTIPNEQLEASDDPVVMFSERPAGAPQAIKAWFYPGERIGQEFVYPKRQAMQLASANHTPVMAFNDESADNSDAAKMRSAQVSRLDDSGAASQAATGSNSANRTTTGSTNDSQPATTASTAAPASSTTASTAPASSASTNTTTAEPTAPSANRSAAVGTTGTTASDRSSASTAVGTSGQQNTGATQQSSGASQSDRSAAGNTASRTLPRTASSLPMIQLLSGLLLAAGLGARQLRKRVGENR